MRATKGTAKTFIENGISCTVIYKISEPLKPNIVDYLTEKKFMLVINTPSPETVTPQAASDGYLIRRKAVEFGIPIVTNLELAARLVEAIIRNPALGY